MEMKLKEKVKKGEQQGTEEKNKANNCKQAILIGLE